MAPGQAPRLRILSVGGNAVSAFLSWRLQATNACDVTLVWKSNYETVSQYGISFKSKTYGNERFKPHSVVRSPEDASRSSRPAFDYVLLCVKALPDVYDIASVIESVVAPQHTCILINTTNTIGIESYIESRFPTNVVLSLVSGAEINQIGASEFEHNGSSEIWVGPASRNASIPAEIQSDMSEALAMTLSSGQVDCKVSPNIRQQQYERVIGPIAFHTASVLFEIPNHAELIEKPGVKEMIHGIIDELLAVAKRQECNFPPKYRDEIVESMTRPSDARSTMYQDFEARRPMEIEAFLGSPLKLAQEVQMDSPRIQLLYALMQDVNTKNQNRPPPGASPQPSVAAVPPPNPRSSSMPMGGPNGRGPPPVMNGKMGGPRPGSRAPSMTGPPPPSHMRRGPPNGYPPRGPPNGYPGPGGPNLNRRPSFDDNNLEEFSHLMMYDTMADDLPAPGMYGDPNASTPDIAMRERELALRQRELAMREREYNMGGRGRGRPMPPPSHGGFDEDDEDDYFDPMGGAPPMVNPDNIDMMSVTSRRNRKQPSAGQLRDNPEMGNPSRGRGGGMFSRVPGMRNKNRTSARVMADIPGLHDSIMQDPLMGYSSNRYGNVDRKQMGQESRTNSLTADKLDAMQHRMPPGPPGGPYGPYGGMQSRRSSHSPGHPLSPGSMRGGGRPSPPNGYLSANGAPNGRPSPPGMRQPVPRHPPGHGNAVAPQQVEQHVGVSQLHPPKTRSPQVRSLTGSASASAGSGDSGASAHLGSDNSAFSSQNSLGPRPAIGVR